VAFIDVEWRVPYQLTMFSPLVAQAAYWRISNQRYSPSIRRTRYFAFHWFPRRHGCLPLTDVSRDGHRDEPGKPQPQPSMSSLDRPVNSRKRRLMKINGAVRQSAPKRMRESYQWTRLEAIFAAL